MKVIYFISFLAFFAMSIPSYALKVVKCEYWIDGNFKEASYVDVSGTDVIFDYNASSLRSTAHTLCYRLLDDTGNWSPVHRKIFFKIDYADAVTSCRYWIDSDYKTASKADIKDGIITFDLDASELRATAHYLSYCLVDNEGNVSPVHRRLFFKTDENADVISWYRYWWNNDYASGVTIKTDASHETSMPYILSEEIMVPKSVYDAAGEERKAILNIVFADNLGNLSEVVSKEFQFDNKFNSVSMAVDDSLWKISVNGRTLTVSGLTVGSGQVAVYTLDGKMAAAAMASTETVNLYLPIEGTYIVTYGKYSRKVICR